MNKIVLTVIGGGSTTWMPALMRDIYLVDVIEGGEIRLVDPNIRYAESVKDMLIMFNKIRNKNFKIAIIEDRKKALEGSDFVMCTISPGSMAAFHNDLEIPIKYGIRQPVSMTVGPCGISASLRTVPVANEIISDMEEMCPGAWMFNVTNPMSTVIRAMNMTAKKIKVIGMCHEFHAFPTYLEHMLGIKQPEGMNCLDFLYHWLPEQGFDYTVAGINHFIFLTKAVYKGTDMLPKIREYCNTHFEFDESIVLDTAPWINRSAAKFALCRQFGYLPLPGDRHLVEFYPSLCNIRNGYGAKYGVSKTTVDKRVHEKESKYEYIKKLASGEEQLSWRPSGEEMVSIMKAIINKTTVTSIVNMPNSGQIVNMPEGRIVETFAKISAEGIKPVFSGELPGSIGSLCRLHSDVHELTVKAALEGSRDLFIEALSLDPSSGNADFSELCDMADDLLKANKEYLPRFFK